MRYHNINEYFNSTIQPIQYKELKKFKEENNNKYVLKNIRGEIVDTIITNDDNEIIALKKGNYHLEELSDEQIELEYKEYIKLFNETKILIEKDLKIKYEEYLEDLALEKGVSIEIVNSSIDIIDMVKEFMKNIGKMDEKDKQYIEYEMFRSVIQKVKEIMGE
jgi:hypothetical protein